MLHLSSSDDRARAADALAASEIAVLAFNGIFTHVGVADDAAVPERIAAAKQRPHAKGVALVCPPEFLGEHVDVDAPILRSTYAFARIQALQKSVHALGVILPASQHGAPRHVVQRETILNVWTEQRPTSPLRQLVLELRRRGQRALVGTSANRSGERTITEADEVAAVFGDRVPLMLRDDFDAVPPHRRRSTSIVDLTGSRPHLVREGSVPAEELRTALEDAGFPELTVDPNLRVV